MANTTTLTLAERIAKLGKSIKTDANEKDTDAPNSSVFAIVGLLLEESEFDALLGKGAHESFFRESKVGGVKQLEPKFSGLKTIEMREKFVGDVTIVLGNQRIELNGEHVTIKSVKLAPQTGGMVAMSLKVVSPMTPKEHAAIGAKLTRECRTEITFGGTRQPKSKKQPELPMGSHAQSETNGSDEQPPATH